MLTKNSKRKAEQVNAANTRAKNTTGHILELLPPGEGKDADHAAAQFKWDVFILAGDPTAADQGAKYGDGIAANGWFANPDNIAFDPRAGSGSTALPFRRWPLCHRDRRPPRRAETVHRPLQTPNCCPCFTRTARPLRQSSTGEN